MFIWVVVGFFVGFDNVVFELSINTLTTIITFLMVFIIQHTQVIDEKVVQAKLDEIIRSIVAARNDFIRLETKTEPEIERIEDQLK